MNEDNEAMAAPSAAGVDAFGSNLQSKNIRIHNRRTSVRLEPEMWSALKEIAAIERCSIHDLCGAVYDLKDPAASFTAALRVFLMEYYRSAARTSQQVNHVQQRLKARNTIGLRAVASPEPAKAAGQEG